jgi:hypothetical protein
MKTTILDLLGVICLMAFTWFVWHPLPLLIVGLSLLATSFRASSPAGTDE